MMYPQPMMPMPMAPPTPRRRIKLSGSNNEIIIAAVLLFVIAVVVGVLLYFFVFKCKDEDDECSTTSDCCDDLECVDGTCSKKTKTSQTPTKTPVAVAAKYCDTWTCSAGKRLISNASTVEYDVGEDDCCRDETCGLWLENGNTCNSRIPLSDDTPGYSEDECCEEGTWYLSEPGMSCHETCWTTATQYCHLENDITSRERLEKVMEAVGFDSSQCNEWSEGTTATCIALDPTNKDICKAVVDLKDSTACMAAGGTADDIPTCTYIPAPILSYDGNGKCSYLSGSDLTNNELIGYYKEPGPGCVIKDIDNWVDIAGCVNKHIDNITGDNDTEKCETCGGIHYNKMITNYCSRKIDDEQQFCKCNNDKYELNPDGQLWLHSSNTLKKGWSPWITTDFFKIGGYHDNDIRYADGAPILDGSEIAYSQPMYETSSGEEAEVWRDPSDNQLRGQKVGNSRSDAPFGLEGQNFWQGDLRELSKWNPGFKSDFDWAAFKCHKSRHFSKLHTNGDTRCLRRNKCSDWSTTSTCPPGTTLTPDGIAYGDTAAECCGPFSVFQERWNQDYGS